MRIAVTGSTGFLGRHVVAALEPYGDDLKMLVRGGQPERDIRDPDRVTDFDLRNPPDDAYVRLGSPEVLIHLAWGGLPDYGSLHHFEEELPGHYRFLKKMIQSGTRSVVVTGTCFEYGMKSGPLDENIVAEPANPYGFAKNALRQELELLRSKIEFDLTWFRLFYLHGRGQSPKALLPQVDAAIANGDRTFRMSGGEQLRDYLAVENAADLIVRLSRSKRNLGIVNLCSGQPVSIRTVVERHLRDRNSGIALELGYYPYSEHEPMAFWGNRSLLDSILQGVADYEVSRPNE